ncbi:hypothetical protein, partial [Streptomyces sp. SID3343]|uniref:hypothetical protein n=1 Tax=Streptomyces sp. SID3343 TaxID=2690260 RepID=UPI0013C16450
RPTRRRSVDWAGLLAAHRADPLPEDAAVLLAADPHCPDDLVVALYEAHPAAVGPIARPCVGVLRAALGTPKHPA